MRNLHPSNAKDNKESQLEKHIRAKNKLMFCRTIVAKNGVRNGAMQLIIILEMKRNTTLKKRTPLRNQDNYLSAPLKQGLFSLHAMQHYSMLMQLAFEQNETRIIGSIGCF